MMSTPSKTERVNVNGHSKATTGEDDDEGTVVLNWEKAYPRTWDVLEEDNEGSITRSLEDMKRKKKKRREKIEGSLQIQRSMMRHLLVVIDASQSMSDQDMRPSKFLCSVHVVLGFIREFLDQNPIGQIGVAMTRKGIAHTVSSLSSQVRTQLSRVEGFLAQEGNNICQGRPSLRNTIELASVTLRHFPSHTSREVIFITGSLVFLDQGDVRESIQSIKKDNITVSVIGLSASVRILQTLTSETGGSYNVALDETHFRELLHNVLRPSASTSTGASLMPMGFPQRRMISAAELCVCHREPVRAGYTCPRCGALCCELPMECTTCGISLISSPQLARSYHHLYPISVFEEVLHPDSERMDVDSNSSFTNDIGTMNCCHTCLRTLIDVEHRYRCPTCNIIVCSECDTLLHEEIHNCPGCLEFVTTKQG